MLGPVAIALAAAYEPETWPVDVEQERARRASDDNP